MGLTWYLTVALTYILLIANGPAFHCYKLIRFCNLIKLRLQKSDGKTGEMGRCLSLIRTPSNKCSLSYKIYDKFLWRKSVWFRVSQRWHCGFQDTYSHMVWPPCPYRQSRTVQRPADHTHPWVPSWFLLFLSLGQWMEREEDGLLSTFPVSNLSAVGTLKSGKEVFDAISFARSS